MYNMTYRKFERKRKRRIERLIQKFNLFGDRDSIFQVWGWNARRRLVNSLAHAR